MTGVKLIQAGIKCAKCGDRFDVDTTPSLEPLPLTWCCDGCGGGGRKPSKYHNSPLEVDGHRFPSIHEAKRYGELKLMEKAGEISALRLQVPFELIPAQIGESACTFIADFVYTRGEAILCEDAKGMRTPAYVIKRKLMLFRHGIRVVEL